MHEAIALGWILSGLAGCNLAWSVSNVRSSEDPDLDAFGKPSHVWFALAGPIMLATWLFIALGYALKWHKE